MNTTVESPVLQERIFKVRRRARDMSKVAGLFRSLDEVCDELQDLERARMGVSGLPGAPSGPLGRGPALTKGHIATRRKPGSFVVEKQGQNVRLREGYGGETWDSPCTVKPLTEEEESVGLFKRGKIEEFTGSSRRRFMRSMQAFDLVGLMSKYYLVFGGLTYPGEHPTAAASKEHFEAFRERMRRRYNGTVIGWWKLEPQKRGAPHYHFLLLIPIDHSLEGFFKLDGFGEPVGYIPGPVVEFDRWGRQAWHEIVGSSDPHHLEHGFWVDLVEKPERVAAYVAKYLGKPQDVSGLTWREPGRFWGVIGRDILKGYLTGEIFVVSRQVYITIRRLLRRYGVSQAKKLARRRAADGRSGNWRKWANLWLLHARRLSTWNTWDPGGGRGMPGMVACLLAKFGYIGVVKNRGIFMR